MSDFKDKEAVYGRLYLFIAPLTLLITYMIFMLGTTFNPETNVQFLELTGKPNDIAGSLAFAYGASGIPALIHIFVRLYRKCVGKGQRAIIAILAVFAIPFLTITQVPLLIISLPYYILMIKYVNKISIDNKQLFSKSRIITLALLLIASVVLTVVCCYF